MKPHPLHLLAGALVWNVIQDKKGGSTICQAVRSEVGPVPFVLGWAALTSWLVPHVVKPMLDEGRLWT